MYILDSTGKFPFPRFFIKTEDEPALYWDGSVFTEDTASKVLYADSDAALKDLHALRMQEFKPTSIETYEIPLVVKVARNQQPIDIEDVRTYLKRALGLFLDIQTHGQGPNESLVVPELALDMIRKT